MTESQLAQNVRAPEVEKLQENKDHLGMRSRVLALVKLSSAQNSDLRKGLKRKNDISGFKTHQLDKSILMLERRDDNSKRVLDQPLGAQVSKSESQWP